MYGYWCLVSDKQSPANYLEKVTVFITRPGADGPELLLIRHPHAGIQLPAGTVDPGESPDAAALREAGEETGLTDLRIHRALGHHIHRPGGEIRFTLADSTVYARPDVTSFDWAWIRRGMQVRALQRRDGWVQMRYEEAESLDDPQTITFLIQGWVPADVICSAQRRHFFHLVAARPAPLPDDLPAVFTDNHRFQPFWARQNALPRIVDPQQRWLAYLLGDGER